MAAIAKILAVVDDESAGVHQMLGAVQYQLGPHPAVPPEADPDWQAASREVDELIADLGWTVAPNAPARALLALTLAALRHGVCRPAADEVRTPMLAACTCPPTSPPTRPRPASSCVVWPPPTS